LNENMISFFQAHCENLRNLSIDGFAREDPGSWYGGRGTFRAWLTKLRDDLKLESFRLMETFYNRNGDRCGPRFLSHQGRARIEHRTKLIEDFVLARCSWPLILDDPYDRIAL
jgi:hypothetical protein